MSFLSSIAKNTIQTGLVQGALADAKDTALSLASRTAKSVLTTGSNVLNVTSSPTQSSATATATPCNCTCPGHPRSQSGGGHGTRCVGGLGTLKSKYKRILSCRK